MKGVQMNSGPLEGIDFSMSPMLTDAITFGANYRVTYPRIGRRLTEEFMDSLQYGQLILTKKNRNPLPIQNEGGMKGRDLASRYTVVNVPLFNYLIRMEQERPKTPFDLKPPEEYWKDWTLDGVVTSSEGGDAFTSDSRATEKIYTLVTNGSVNTFNIWGDEIKPGTRLFFLFGKFQGVSDYFNVAPTAGPRWIEHMAKSMKQYRLDNGLTDRPYQLIPYADSRHQYPPEEALIYEDDFGLKKRALVIEVGIVDKMVPGSGSASGGWDMATDIAVINMQPQIQIFLQPNDLLNF